MNRGDTKSTDTPRQRKRGPRKWFTSDGIKMPSLHNMSPVRKRIELRRRAAAEYYAICGVQA